MPPELLGWGGIIEDPRDDSDWEAGKPWPRAGIGTRTARDLLHGSPPDQLVHPFLTPDGATCLYGKGGVGKGLLACWLMRELVRTGHMVMIIDFEGHEREWGSRLRGLGLTDEELGRIHYRAPFGDDWTARRGSLADVADLVREDRERVGATILMVDSYTPATSTGDTMGGAPAAQEYFGALVRIGLPSLTIAHVRGDSERFPDRPFGSVFVHNLARETWAVEQLAVEDESDHDWIRVDPHVVALELRNKKANGRAQTLPQFVTFSFYGDDTIEVDRGAPEGRSVASLAAAVLSTTPGLTPTQIVKAIKEDSGQVVNEDTLSRKLRGLPAKFVANRSHRPYTWSVR